MFAFAGPAYLVSVGYMDPGNWATDLEGGSTATSNGGGGGHRTHVRKPSATGIYIISRLSRASRLSAPQPAGSPISQLLMFSPLTPERGLEPVTGI